MKRVVLWLAEVSHTLLGMSGLRLDRGIGQILVSLALLVGSGFFWVYLPPDRTLVLLFASIVWLLYYGGLIFFFRLGIPRRLIARFGEDRSYRIYEIILGVLFYNQGACQVKMVELSGTLPGAYMEGWWFPAVPILLIGSGFVVKTWATMLTGLDTYYCRDMYTSRPGHVKLVRKGPYRLFRNPMYGVGNLTAYGSTWLNGSLPGIICAAVFQLSIYLFNFAAERPEMRKIYGSPA